MKAAMAYLPDEELTGRDVSVQVNLKYNLSPFCKDRNLRVVNAGEEQ